MMGGLYLYPRAYPRRVVLYPVATGGPTSGL